MTDFSDLIGRLEALMHEIHVNRRTMASPFMDWMNKKKDGLLEIL